MTDNEIIKALEICNSMSIRCGNCSYYQIPHKDGKSCSEIMLDDAIDLINRQKAEIKNLNRAIKNFKATKERQRAEIERLQHILVSFMSEVENWDYKYNIDTSHIPQIAVLGTEKGNILKQIKSEAYKEFAERLKKKGNMSKDGIIVVDYQIDNLLEELQNGVKE